MNRPSPVPARVPQRGDSGAGRQTKSRRSTSVTTLSITMTKAARMNIPAKTPATSNTPLGLLDQVAEAGGRAEVFADHGADHGEADRGVQRGEHPRQRRGPVDVAQQLPLVHAQHTGIGEHGGAHFLDALIDIEEHDEKDERHAERDLGPDAEAEPQHEDRGQNDARQGIRRLHIGVEDRGDARLAGRTRSRRPRRWPSRWQTPASFRTR